MNVFTIAFIIFVLAVVAVSLSLYWHWKTYMPERGRGAGVFIIYTVGLIILFALLFGFLNS